MFYLMDNLNLLYIPVDIQSTDLHYIQANKYKYRCCKLRLIHMVTGYIGLLMSVLKSKYSIR